MPLNIVILAAGQGTRMCSAVPKVMHPLAGKPLLEWVLDAAAELQAERNILVHGQGADQIKAAYADRELDWVLQQQQRGTGHAVQQAAQFIASDAQILVLYGDVPLIHPDTLAALLDKSRGKLGLLTVELDDPAGYGRILRDAQGKVERIVEHRDASADELRVTEINTGIMCLSAEHLLEWLPRLDKNNAQGEYYLTDLIAIAVNEGVDVVTAQPGHPCEVAGVNTRAQMAALERHYQITQAHRLMDAGVSLADPARFDVRGEAVVATDVNMDVNVILEGEVQIDTGVSIEANCIIRNSRIGAGARILANSVIESAVVGPDTSVGPFARLRPGAELDRGAKVGNFVEIKKARIGAGTKVNHLSYIGDAELGAEVNVGAGTITANYDGRSKHRTLIGDGASTGANSVMVAPVKIGSRAYIGAGSIITKDVPPGDLAIARGRQRNIPRQQEKS